MTLYRIRTASGVEQQTNDRATAAKWAKETGHPVTSDGVTWWRWKDGGWRKVGDVELERAEQLVMDVFGLR